jgi:threonylcarbamoyladenosine tRNA methylthiotransferase MtaB
VDGGSHEIVLTGVNMSRYRDGSTDFATLVGRCLAAADGHWRMRISSLVPDRLDDRFVDLFHHPRMAPHLHLCLQSGAPRTLLAMRRQYTIEEYRSLAGRLREIDPLFNITTDIIVGFPGESDADFEESLAAIDEFGFGHVHTFPYSVRGGTRAERMPGHLPERVKTDRARQVRDAAERSKRAYRERHVGRDAEVLIERVNPLPGPERGGFVARGLTAHYVPVRFDVAGTNSSAVGDPQERLENRIARVRLVGLDDGDDPDLLGELVALA